MLAALVCAAGLLRLALGYYAADLFLSVLGRSAARAGFEVVLDGAPDVSIEGFSAAGLSLRGVGGGELLRAGSVRGMTDFSPWPPFVKLSLTLGDVETALDREGAEPANLSLPLLPSILSSISVERARIDAGAGRIIDFDGEIVPAGESLSIVIGRAGYLQPSGELAAEKLAMDVLIRGSAPGAPDALGVEVKVTQGAALAGSVLIDFAAHPLGARGTLARRDDGGLRLSELSLSLGKLLGLAGRLDLDKDAAPAAADIEVISDNLRLAFETLVREPFGGSTPALADATIDGSARLHLQMQSASRHSTSARLTLSSRQLRTRSVEADALEVELPWIGQALRGAPESRGRLRAGRLALLSLPWNDVAGTLVATPGRVRVVEIQDWKTLGGIVHLSDLLYEDDAGAGPRLSARVRIDDLDLRLAGEAAGIAGVTGSLGGDLGRVRLDADSLRADGALEAKTFGGTVALSRLSIENPFSRIPETNLDLVASEIDLSALTAAMGFGRVSGVLEGRVTGLVIADGQPQAFDADLHTVRRSGVSQTVDVRAIVQLGVLGGGDTGSVTGALLKVVDRYRYSALGLKARLRNDVFELRGVESDKGKDYIVKGSLLPPSVSVVSHSQVISFSEMLRRVQRVTSIGEGGTPDAASE